MTEEKKKFWKNLRWTLVVALLVAQFVTIGWVISKSRKPTEVREVPDYKSWSEESLAAASRIPVQDGGRIKPLSSFARFQLLGFLGKTKIKIKSGDEKLSVGATAWMLDLLFRPELAHQLPVFRVNDSDFLKALGVETSKRAAVFSFEELRPIGEKLTLKAIEADKKRKDKGEKSLTLEEEQALKLAGQMITYAGIERSLEFARKGMVVEDKEPFLAALGESGIDRLSGWLSFYPQFAQIIREQNFEDPSQLNPKVRDILNQLESYAQPQVTPVVRFFPAPEGGENDEWDTYSVRLAKLLSMKSSAWQDTVADFKELEDVAQSEPNSEAFVSGLEKWAKTATSRVDGLDLGKKLDGEVSYYEKGFFSKALGFFVFGFVVTALSWFSPRSSWGRGAYLLSAALIGIGFIILSWGIFQRSSLMGRPPVGNLYDTIPFITAGAVFLLLFAEYFTRRRLLLALAGGLGFLGILMAFRFEFGRAVDHMDPLVAVLNSNYWLATHVVTITLGYSGGLVACFLSHIYVHVRLAGVIEDDKKYQRFMTRAVYGVICFTLLFSLVGTVLGGIWANDSWGRFWGWDPKENGALMIVLWCLVILHARLAGWVKDWGIHLMSIFLGMVVAFSWWHVNMLEVGLHSYGFIDGGEVIWYFYLIELIAMLVGAVAWFVTRGERQSQQTSSGDLSAVESAKA